MAFGQHRKRALAILEQRKRDGIAERNKYEKLYQCYVCGHKKNLRYKEMPNEKIMLLCNTHFLIIDDKIQNETTTKG